MEEKIRRCSGVFIYRTNREKSEIEYLFIQTANFTDAVGHYLDTVVGGRFEEEDKGNSLEEKGACCARRETREEVGLDLENILFLGIVKAKGKDIGYKDPQMDFEFYHYAAQAIGEVMAGLEVKAYGWYTKSQIQTRNMEEQLRHRALEYAIQIENHTQK